MPDPSRPKLVSLRARVVRTILGIFTALTAVIAVVSLLVLNDGLKDDLRARANVIGHAMQESAEVSVGARAGSGPQVARGLEWLSSVGDEMVVVLVRGSDGVPLAGVGSAGPLSAEELAAASVRPEGAVEVVHEMELGRALAEPERAADDVEAAIAAENGSPAAAKKPPTVRIVLTGQGQLLRQAVTVALTGALLCIVAVLALVFITRDAFRRVVPAFEQARRMADGDFTEHIGDDYAELAQLFDALNGIGDALSGTIADVRGLSDEVTVAVDRIKAAATALRSGADLGKNAVAVTEGAVSATVASVDETARLLSDLAATADISSRDTEAISRSVESTSATVLTLRADVERQARSLLVIGERARALSRDAGAVAESSEAARGSGKRMEQVAAEGVQRATEAARFADDAMRDTNVGGKAIEDAVGRIQEIAGHAGTMEDTLRGLTDKVEGMNPVLSAIADVTSRTGLLALNAGIIAAQAGERGAAFQVVVDELKSLASRTAQLTGTVEGSVRTVLEQRGRTEGAAQALREVVGRSIDDAHRAANALVAIRSSTEKSQQVSATIAATLTLQAKDVKDTLERIEVVDAAGRSVDASARALAEEARVLKEIAERVGLVSEDVNRAAQAQGELVARVGGVLALTARQVREISASQGAQRTDVQRVSRSLAEIRRVSDDAHSGAGQLEAVVERVRQKAAGLSQALHRFRTRG